MKRRRSPQQLRAERTRRRLLEAARRVFSAGGYEGTAVDDIARAAGCSKGAYYFHFASKEEVLLALVEDWTRNRTRRLGEVANGGGPPDTTLIALLEALLSPRATDGWKARLLLEFWSQGERNAKVRRRLARAYRSWRGLLARTFRRAQQAGVYDPDGGPEAAADAALVLHDGLVVRACLGRLADASPRARAGAALALLVGPWTLRAAKTGARRPSRAAG